MSKNWYEAGDYLLISWATKNEANAIVESNRPNGCVKISPLAPPLQPDLTKNSEARGMCEIIVEELFPDITVEQIWDPSPKGGFWHVHLLYQAALKYREVKRHRDALLREMS